MSQAVPPRVCLLSYVQLVTTSNRTSAYMWNFNMLSYYKFI